MSSSLFLIITTIGEAHGDVEGRIILADSSPLIKYASFSGNLGGTGRTLCAIGLGPPTSISHIAPRAAGGSVFPLPMIRCLFLQMSCLNRSWSSVSVRTGSPT